MQSGDMQGLPEVREKQSGFHNFIILLQWWKTYPSIIKVHIYYAYNKYKMESSDNLIKMDSVCGKLTN